LYATCSGQEVSGYLEGRVVDALGAQIEGASITVTGPNAQGFRAATTNDDGYFRVLGLPVGVYTVRIRHVAYRNIMYQDVHIRLGKTTTLNGIRLESRISELPEVVIIGMKPSIDISSTTIGSNLHEESFRSLPTERNFRSIISLTPQTNASYLGDEVNISGSTGFENIYFVDGINVTDPYDASTSTSLPYNFIKEIEVNTGGYNAEYGRALGGVINLITPSGGNEFHGEVFGFFTNNSLTTEGRRGFIEPKVGAFSQYDFGLSLSGPISRDQVWFFAAYNASFDKENVEIPGLGFYQDWKRSHMFSGKITWQPDGETNIGITISGDPTEHHRVGIPLSSFPSALTLADPDPFLGYIKSGGMNISLTARYIVSQNFLLEGSISRFYKDQKSYGETERGQREPYFMDLTTGVLSGGYGMYANHPRTRISTNLIASIFLSEHRFKVGAEYEDNRVDQNYAWTAHGIGLLFRTGDSNYIAQYGSTVGEDHNRILSLFVQDSWLLGDRLRLNFGLRWEGQYMFGPDGELAQKITNQFQPRIGFIYQPGELGSQKLFGSYGRYYEQIPNLFSTIYHIERVEYITYYNHNPLVDSSGGVRINIAPGVTSNVEGLEGQHFDEFILGYEKNILSQYKIGVRGIYRTLRQVVEDAVDVQTGRLFYGNPGSGLLSFLPKFTRDYSAVELTIEKSSGDPFTFMASYVLSQNYGNYAGLYGSENGIVFPNATRMLDIAEQIPNSTGLLPNDRPHVFKFFGSYKFDIGFTVGTSFIWQSGTPLNDMKITSFGGPLFAFIQERGTAGRTPSIWDLNLRFSYEFNNLHWTVLRPRLLVDVFHLLSQRSPVNYEQLHYLDPGQTVSNPNYGRVTQYQPPMTVRLGIEVDF